MDQRQIYGLLRGLRSRRPQEAWEQFLQEYSGPILQVIHFHERDPDHISDCFVFVCEQLTRNRFRRLCRFRPDGPATFSTWLRAVVRNLCLDWRRKEFGRQRVFESVGRLSALDQEVFRCIYERGTTPGEAFLSLLPRFPGLTPEAVRESEGRVFAHLSPRQRWMLGMGRPRGPSKLASSDQVADLLEAIPDERASPESSAVLAQMYERVQRAVSDLSPDDRLLLQLRFEQDLTLDQLARLLDLGGAQRVDRRIREILARLREELGQAPATASGKTEIPSVKKDTGENHGFG